MTTSDLDGRAPLDHVLVLAPYRRDAEYLRALLSEQEIRVELCPDGADIDACLARWPGVLRGGPLVYFALTDLFVVAAMVYDRRTRGRVHPAYWWGGGLLLASQVGRLVLSGTSAWLACATWLTR